MMPKDTEVQAGDKLKEKLTKCFSKVLGQRAPLECFQCALALVLQVSGSVLDNEHHSSNDIALVGVLTLLTESIVQYVAPV